MCRPDAAPWPCLCRNIIYGTLSHIVRDQKTVRITSDLGLSRSRVSHGPHPRSVMRLSSATIGLSVLSSSQRGLRRFTLVLAGLWAGACIAGCNPFSQAAASSDQPTVKVGVVPGIDSATLYLAEKRGYFSHAGIDVRIVDFTSVTSELRALNAGQVNIAAGDYGNLFSAKPTLPKNAFKIIADGYDAAPGVVEIMTMPNSPVQAPSDLSTIGAPNTDEVHVPTEGPSSLVIASATSVLQSDRVNLSGLTWKAMSQSDEISQLASGKLKAALLTEPYIYQAQQAGAVQLIDVCSGSTAGIPLSGYFTSASWSRNKSKEVGAFRA